MRNTLNACSKERGSPFFYKIQLSSSNFKENTLKKLKFHQHFHVAILKKICKL